MARKKAPRKAKSVGRLVCFRLPKAFGKGKAVLAKVVTSKRVKAVASKVVRHRKVHKTSHRKKKAA